MEHLPIASLRAIGSLFTAGMFGVILLSIALTIVILSGFTVAASSFIVWASSHWLTGAVAHWLPWLGGIGTFFIALALFPGIMPVIVSFFDDRIARIIERNEYPGNAPGHVTQFWPEFMHDAGFSLFAIILNIGVIPFYIFVPVPLLFYPLNGYLLGREFFVMAARRHMPVHEAEALRKRHNGTIFIAGIILTLLATVPLVNLFAPFWGVAVMVHLYHRFTSSPTIQVLPPQ